jgi:ESF2/ABP1 family protein
MTSIRREVLLDFEEEGDISDGYDSETENLHKGGRATKRRRLSGSADDDASYKSLEDDDGDEEEDASADATELATYSGELATHVVAQNQQRERDGPDSELPPQEATEPAQGKRLRGLPKHAPKQLTRKNLVAGEAAIKASGVVFLSRIPPFMKPLKLRSLLSPHGAINRIFLSPEDPSSRGRRLRSGGNKKRSYGEGWVEFVSKRDARRACDLLNGRPVGGKKGSYYRDDVWNLLYLKGFKWRHLTEQIATENAERDARMRAEISRTTKENAEFARNVETAKMLKGMEAKSAAKAGGQGQGADDDAEGTQGVDLDVRFIEAEGMGNKRKRGFKDRPRSFKQTPVAKRAGEDGGQAVSEDVKRMLSKIF